MTHGDHDTLRAAVEQLVENIEQPDDLRFAIVEAALALWHESDGETNTLTCLIGGIESAKQVLFMYLGDNYNDE